MVQLPGVQDTAKGDILGRTATLELRMVDEGVKPRGRTGHGARAVRL